MRQKHKYFVPTQDLWIVMCLIQKMSLGKKRDSTEHKFYSNFFKVTNSRFLLGIPTKRLMALEEERKE